MRITLAILLTVFASSCATTGARSMSSGQIGCPESEIDVVEIDNGAWTGRGQWRATCRGRTFYCSTTPGYAWSFTPSCREELQ